MELVETIVVLKLIDAKQTIILFDFIIKMFLKITWDIQTAQINIT